MNIRYLFVLLALLPLLAQAKQLSPEEALQRCSSSQHRIAAQSKLQKTPTFTLTNAEGSKILYAFNRSNGNGYVILSADDCALPVLAYSENGTFDADNMPDNLRWWLSQYEKEIAQGIAMDMQSPAYAPAEREEIAPLITTQWDQSSPYNNLCPANEYGQAVTGCVATAMAQVMNYHKWPVSAKKSGLRYYYYDSFKFGSINSTYDWDNMLDKYDFLSNDQQRKAVAQLMVDCGMAVGMQYTNESSGAFDTAIVPALIDIFGYSKSTTYVRRQFYNYSQWERMIYTELSENRPLIYAGANQREEGHEFICDGYKDGYFHFNWGWSGVSDGYFLLTSLNPMEQGIGGSIAGFDLDQSIIIGMQRPGTNDKIRNMMVCMGDLCTDVTTCQKGEIFNITTSNDGMFGNYGSYTIKNLVCGIKVMGNGITRYYEGSTVGDIPNFRGFSYFQTLIDELEDGDYIITPAFMADDNDEWFDMLTDKSFIHAINLNVSGNTLTFSQRENALLAVSNAQVQGKLHIGSRFKFNAILTCADEYYGDITPSFVVKGTDNTVATSQALTAEVLEGVHTDFIYAGQIEATNYNPAANYEYEIVLKDLNGREIYRADADLLPAVANTSYKVENLYVEKLPSYKHDIHIVGTLTCTEGYYSDQVKVSLFPYNNAEHHSSLTSYYTDYILADEGESVRFDIHGEYIFANEGEGFFISAKGSDGKWIPEFYFSLIDAEDMPENVFTVAESATEANRIEMTTDGTFTGYASHIALVDGYPYYLADLPYDINADRVTYSRKYGHNNWQVAYLPFSISYDELKNYADINPDDNKYEIITLDEVDGDIASFTLLAEGEEIPANTPFIFKPRAAGEMVMEYYNKQIQHLDDATPLSYDWTFTGTYKPLTGLDEQNAYVLSSGQFYRAGSNVVLNPFRAALMQPTGTSSQNRLQIAVKRGEESGIPDTIIDSQEEGALYDLQGRKVEHPSAGIYIFNGQKIIIK